MSIRIQDIHPEITLFQLIAAVNLYTWGYLGDMRCYFASEQVMRYRSKVSGPLMVELICRLNFPHVDNSMLRTDSGIIEESSEVIVERVRAAREIRQKRSGKVNYLLKQDDIKQYCSLKESDCLL